MSPMGDKANMLTCSADIRFGMSLATVARKIRSGSGAVQSREPKSERAISRAAAEAAS